MARSLATLIAVAGMAGIALLGGAGPASAAAPEVTIRGPYCSPAGCPGTPRSGLGSVAGFATAAGTALLLARRREHR